MSESGLKILNVDISGRGGIAHYIYLLCDALHPHGIHNILVTTGDNELNLVRCSFMSRKILNSHHRKRFNLSKGIIYLASLTRLFIFVYRERPDIVHWHEIKLPFIEYLIIRCFKKMGIRIVYTAHDVYRLDDRKAYPYLIKEYRIFDFIISHAEENRGMIINDMGVPIEKTKVVPHGEYTYLVGEEQKKQEARLILGIPTKAKVLLFFGYIRKYKGLTVLIHAISRVRMILPDIILVIAGQPKEDFTIYEREIERLGLKDVVLTHLKYIPLHDISTYFWVSDIVVLPYLNIHQSGIAHLAFAHRRPVIVTSVGGLPEVVEEGKNGYIIPPGDSCVLASAIIDAFSDIREIEKMGDYAFQHASVKYSWDKIAEQTIEVYHRLLSKQ